MPYLAFDFDALEQLPNVARSCGASEGDIALGLLRQWQWCWREKTDVVTFSRVRGFFGLDATAALMDFGFLEPLDDGFRVMGADRYLRIREARSAGGHAAKGNLIPGARQKKSSSRLSRENAESQPRGSPAVSPEASRLVLGSPASSEQLLKKEVVREQKPNPPATQQAELLETERLSQSPKADKPKRERRKSSQESFYSWACSRREEALAGDYVPDKQWAIERQNTALKDAMECDDTVLSAAYELFLADTKKRGLDPPCPMWCFAQDWPEYASKVTRKAAANGNP